MPWKAILFTVLALAAIALIAFLYTIPQRRMAQVGEYLRRLLEDPSAAARLPRELQSLAGELAALRQRLLSQQEEVRRSEQRRQELTAYLAHDLKTPLTSVLGYLDLLQNGPDLTPDQREKYTQVALDKAKRLEELVEEFFDINAMDLSLTVREPVQLSFLLEQLSDEFFPLFTEKGLTCVPEISSGLVVTGDGDRLARVFENVLRNAVSYSSFGGQVGLTAQESKGSAVVTVTNEGLEIPERELSNIFEKFYRLDSARSTRTGGAGLGLAIAKEIVELHGGTIRAESTGCRTAFVITLPLRRG